MEEFPDELIAKYTRKELEAMAIDLEITTVGLSTKAQLAEAIFEAKRKMEVKAAELEPSEEAAEAVPAEKVAWSEPSEKAAEAVPAEKVTKVKLQVGGKGVLAKMAAIESESRSMHDKALAIQKAGQNMRREGVEQMRVRVSEMQKGIDEQMKENQRSIKNFDRGVSEIRADIDKESRLMREKASAIQKAGQDIRQDGINRMMKNVGDFTAEINEFVKVDLENYVRDFYYG